MNIYYRNIVDWEVEDGRTAPGVCGNGSIPLSHSVNVITRLGIHTQTGKLKFALQLNRLHVLIG